MYKAIGCLCTQSYYVDHVASIWLALPKRWRGPFFVSSLAKEAAIRHGIPSKFIVKIPDGGSKRSIAQSALYSANRWNPNQLAVLTASWGDFRITQKMRGVGTPTIPHGQGGPGSSNDTWNNAVGLDFMMVPAEYGRGDLNGIKTIVINGQPKLDRWYGHIPPVTDKPILAISFRWRDSHSAVEHYKPFLQDIKREADEKGVHLLGHGHPLKFHSDFVKMWDDLEIESTPSFDEVLERAHVYAADCSSSSFECVGLDRPVVFLHDPKYVNFSFGPRFTLGPKAGIINEDPSKLIDDALLAYSDPPEIAARRREVAKLMFGDYKGEASKNAAETLVEFYGGILR